MRTLTLLTLAALGGCAASTAGTTPSPSTRSPTVRVAGADADQVVLVRDETSVKDRSFTETVPAAWGALLAAYGELKLPVTETLSDQFRIQTESVRTSSINGSRMSRYFDCGTSTSGNNADHYDVSVTMTSTVSAAEGGSRVVSEVDAYARPRMMSGAVVHCRSKGTLEAMILDEVGKQLGGG